MPGLLVVCPGLFALDAAHPVAGRPRDARHVADGREEPTVYAFATRKALNAGASAHETRTGGSVQRGGSRDEPIAAEFIEWSTLPGGTLVRRGAGAGGCGAEQHQPGRR